MAYGKTSYRISVIIMSIQLHISIISHEKEKHSITVGHMCSILIDHPIFLLMYVPFLQVGVPEGSHKSPFLQTASDVPLRECLKGQV